MLRVKRNFGEGGRVQEKGLEEGASKRNGCTGTILPCLPSQGPKEKVRGKGKHAKGLEGGVRGFS